MGSTCRDSFGRKEREKNEKGLDSMATKKTTTSKQPVKSVAPYEDDEFDFLQDSFEDEVEENNEELLPENSATSAINCAFIGVGGGGGKLAKAFLDLGFSRTVLVNTTDKDKPKEIEDPNFLLIPGADGVGKDVELGRKILEENSAMVEDVVRARLGAPDWIFVLAGGGGGTGSACTVLDESLQRSLNGAGSKGKVVYIISKPTSQELLNSTIKKNFEKAVEGLEKHPHIILDNEKQHELLRNKVGMLNLHTVANKNFAKLLAQVLKLAESASDIQTFDTKDLEKCLSAPGRIVIGSSMIRDTARKDLGSAVFTNCIAASSCPPPSGDSETGALLLLLNSQTASDPKISKNLEAAFSYVGGRTKTLFSGVYVREKVPGVIAICVLSGCR